MQPQFDGLLHKAVCKTQSLSEKHRVATTFLSDWVFLYQNFKGKLSVYQKLFVQNITNYSSMKLLRPHTRNSYALLIQIFEDTL